MLPAQDSERRLARRGAAERNKLRAYGAELARRELRLGETGQLLLTYLSAGVLYDTTEVEDTVDPCCQLSQSGHV